MKLKVNGKADQIQEERFSIRDFLVRKGITPESVAVELNGEIVHRAEYPTTHLKDGDTVEIVRFVGGG